MKILPGLFAFVAFGFAQQAADRPRVRPLPAASKDLKTGPEPGAMVPGFTLSDQQGRARTLASITGRNGLLLYFVRSADW